VAVTTDRWWHRAVLIISVRGEEGASAPSANGRSQRGEDQAHTGAGRVGVCPSRRDERNSSRGVVQHQRLDVTSTFTTGDATSFLTEGTNFTTRDNDDFAAGTQINLTDDGSFVRSNGNLTVAWNDGHYSDFHFTDDDPDIFNSVNSCVVAGVITYG
jgi:hypothetical protein